MVGHLLHSFTNIDQADALIKENRRITINELAESLGVSAGSAVKIMDTLGYSKVCARWFPKQLTEAHKQSRLEACSELLEYCHSEKTFLQRIVIGDETWVHHLVEWLKRRAYDQHGLGLKPTCAILLCPWERHFTALSLFGGLGKQF